MLQYGNHTEEVYKRLRELIVSGDLAPGTRIIEADIVDSLGVSRTPVRAALQLLLQEGFLVSVGTRKKSKLAVAPLTREDSRELFTLVGALEGIGAMHSARLGDSARAALVADLRSINQNLADSASVDERNQNTLFDLDQQFHATYVEAAAGPRILGLHRSTKPQAERYIRLYMSALTDEILVSVREHETIVSAIEAAEPVRAREAVETNWANAASRLSTVIGELGERGGWLRRTGFRAAVRLGS